MEIPSQCQLDILALQDKFLSDFESVMIEQSLPNPRKRIIMLSGGTESLHLVATARYLWPDDELHTVNFQGTSTEDSRGADEIAAYFGTTHHTYQLSVKNFLDHFPQLKGTGYTRFSQAMFHLCFSLSLADYDLTASNVYQGNGAEELYGSARSRVYRDAGKIAKERNCSLDEARTQLKRQAITVHDGDQRGKSSLGIFMDIVKRRGGTPVTPYRHDRLNYMTMLPFSVTTPLDKTFVKNAMAQRYHLGDLVHRPKISLQEGTGLSQELRDALVNNYRHLGESPGEIVAKLSVS